ncbi:MAG: UDP-glucose--hexose-1-phosphate uridylyltransferase [Bacteroidota bacterium]
MFSNRPHRRYNILTGEWVLVSPHRTKRPWQGKTENKSLEERPEYDPNCYLCPTNTRAGGAINPDYESTFSFVNDFGALLLEGEDASFEEGLLKAETEKGICKVLCFSPNHSLTLPKMDINGIQDVVKMWIKEYHDLGHMEGINHVQIFENKGGIMGCSNPHPHGQIWAQSTIPEEPRKKAKQQKAYFNKNQSSLLGDYLKQELDSQERVVFENDSFVALVPFWATWPYETMVVPKKHYQHIGLIDDKEERDFAEILKILTTKYDNLFEVSFPYSAGIHQMPTDGKVHPEWHFHMSFYPPLLRSATIKKFMVGYEMFANPQRDITAEQAALQLKEMSITHYSLKKIV